MVGWYGLPDSPNSLLNRENGFGSPQPSLITLVCISWNETKTMTVEALYKTAPFQPTFALYQYSNFHMFGQNQNNC